MMLIAKTSGVTCFLLLCAAFILPAEAIAQRGAWSDDRGESGKASDLLALGPDVEKSLGPPIGPPLTGPALEQRTEEVSVGIRCPVCQGHSIKDSPSESARNMKRQTRALLAAGYSEEQILHYFETAYGEFIRTKPKAEGLNLLVWLLPGLAIVLGLFGVMHMLRNNSDPEGTSSPATSSSPTPSDEDEGTTSIASDPWIERVRAQVEGTDV